jgi:hypothetical protein
MLSCFRIKMDSGLRQNDGVAAHLEGFLVGVVRSIG